MELQVKQLVAAIRQIAEEKNLPEEAVHDIIEQALAAAYRKDYGDKEQEIRAQINLNTSEVSMFVSKEVAENVEDPQIEISVKDAKAIKPDAEVGEVVEVLEVPSSFGRVAAQTAKQVILQKIREAEREIVLTEYQDKIGQVINGVVQRVEARLIRVDLGKATGILPASEQIHGEMVRSGSRIKVYLKDVEKTNHGPQLILSRAAPEFIEYLFRNEVPEMDNGAVEIKAISREAGVRTKIAVASAVPGVDPVGTFVGGHGTRVQAVMSEIGDQEKIDIVPFNDDTKTFITSALSPTEVAGVELDEKNKKAVVRVPEDQLSVAIGKSGQNVRLASKLTGYEVDIVSSGEDKVSTPERIVEPKIVKTEIKAKRPLRKSEIEDSLLSAIEAHGEESGTSQTDQDEDDMDSDPGDDTGENQQNTDEQETLKDETLQVNKDEVLDNPDKPE